MNFKRLPIFLTIQGGCYAVFLFLDLRGDHLSLTTGIKFSVILLCFVYSLWVREGNGARDLYLIRLALFFTLISDFIILLLPAKAYLYGVGSFLIVQQLYGVRLKCSDNRRRGLKESSGFLASLLLRLTIELMIAQVLLLGLAQVGVRRNSLMTASVFYIVCLIHNVITSVRLAIRRPREISNTIFAVGLVFFLLCDINVGLFNLSGFIDFTGVTAEFLYQIASLLMWTFYAPSQILIALSAERLPSKITKNRKKIM